MRGIVAARFSITKEATVFTKQREPKEESKRKSDAK